MRVDKKKGIFFILLSATSFAGMSTFVRLSGDIPTIEKAFFRNVVALAVSGIIFLTNRRTGELNHAGIKFIAGRAIFGTLGLVCNFYAIGQIALADANMLNKMSPFFAVIFSAIFLKEKISVKQIFLILCAFSGSLLIIKPSISNLAMFPSLIGALGGMFAGAAYASLRGATTHGVDKNFVIFTFSVFSTVVLLPFMLLNFTRPTLMQLIYLLLCGACSACGQLCITTAYSHAPAKDISIYDYSQVVFSTLFGIIIFNQIPDALSFIGYAIIIGIALYNFISS